ncbi:uncharacterized protein ARMOST_15469 [Armillaria ostoyae]|uniref:DUF6533 domain-containing protein n=1 Tax=Armillaria ostoyae TaxID=47428 RepID=A0A284RTK1_ARMOS|nr:uncharacterized protein ARMOST_15469 [Armillaria ostoyae]
MVRTILVQEVAKYITWSLIFWDYLITLDDEITLFWFSRRSWIKFLFFANRYMGLILRIWDIIWEHLADADNTFSYFLCRQVISSIDAIEACLVATESGSVLYVTMQLFVIESILVLRVWAIMGRRRWILWTFFGLLVCSTATSIMFNVHFFMVLGTFKYTMPTLIFDVIIFVSAAYHVIKVSGGLRSLLLRSSVLYFMVVLCSLPFMAFLDPRLGLTIMSVMISHMLLHLRKQVLSDTVGPPSQKVELTTFRATTNGAMSLEVGRDVIDIGPYPEGS